MNTHLRVVQIRIEVYFCNICSNKKGGNFDIHVIINMISTLLYTWYCDICIYGKGDM